jgi:hypothetical protein
MLAADYFINEFRFLGHAAPKTFAKSLEARAAIFIEKHKLVEAELEAFSRNIAAICDSANAIKMGQPGLTIGGASARAVRSTPGPITPRYPARR